VDQAQDLINYQMARAEEYSSLFFATRNLLRNVEIDQLWHANDSARPPRLSGYFAADTNQLRATEIILADLASTVGNKPKVLVIFPRDRDILAQNEAGRRHGPAFATFVDNLSAKGWKIIDLSASPEIRRSKNLSLGCSAHWNASTNRLAAEYINGQMNQLGITK
jgi:hypothetical protein